MGDTIYILERLTKETHPLCLKLSSAYSPLISGLWTLASLGINASNVCLKKGCISLKSHSEIRIHIQDSTVTNRHTFTQETSGPK